VLRHAVAVSAAGDLDKCVDDIFRLMIAFTSDLLVLSQVPLLRRLDQLEQALPSSHEASVRDWVEKSLPSIERLHLHLVNLAKAHATVKHTGGMGQRKAGKAAAEAAKEPVMRLVRETETMAAEQAFEHPRPAAVEATHA